MQKIWPELQQMQKKVEHSLVEQRSCVGWKYRPYREKKLKIVLLNKTVFKVKFKVEGKNCALQISAHHFFWEKYLTEFKCSLFFLTFYSEVEKENQNMFFWPWQIYLKYLGVIKMRDKDEISIWNIGMCIKWEKKFQDSYCLLSRTPWIVKGNKSLNLVWR